MDWKDQERIVLDNSGFTKNEIRLMNYLCMYPDIAIPFGIVIGFTSKYCLLPVVACYMPKIWLLTTTTGFSAYYINTFIGFNKKQATAIITLACIILASIYTIWNESLPKVMQHPQAANLTKSRIDKLEKETSKRP